MPLEWLHLTLQGVGFADRVPDADLADIIEATRRRLTTVDPSRHHRPRRTRPGIHPAPVTPIEPLQRLRDITRAAITDVWGDDAVPELPDLNPHITLAYCTTTPPPPPSPTRLSPRPTPTTLSVSPSSPSPEPTTSTTGPP